MNIRDENVLREMNLYPLWVRKNAPAASATSADVVRAREAAAAGFPRNLLADLARAGDILRLSRGVYTLDGLHLDAQMAAVVRLRAADRLRSVADRCARAADCRAVAEP